MFLGSPLKGNSIEAYSINQRNAFILHHQQLQQQDHNRMLLSQFSNSNLHLNSSTDDSPLLQGYTPAGSTASPMANSPNMQQFFSVNIFTLIVIFI